MLQSVIAGSTVDVGAPRITQALADYNLPNVRKNLKVGLPVFRPESYGAVCDGTTDDSAAWTALIADLHTAGAGTIMLPAATTVCGPGIIKLTMNSSIIGQGLLSVIKQTPGAVSGSFLIDASGTSQSNVVGYNTLRDFTVDGGTNAGGSYAIRMYYNAHSVLSNLYGNNFNPGFLDAVQLWDTRIDKIQLNFCGGWSGNQPSIWLRNSGAASGFGFSSDTNNQNFLHDIRMEDPFGTGLQIEQGPGNTQPPNGIYCTKIKIETNNLTGSPLVLIGPGVTQCTFEDFYLSANHISTYFPNSPASDGIVNNGGGSNTFGKIRVNMNSAGVLNSPIRHSATNVDSYTDLVYNGGVNTAPNDGCLLNVTAGAVQPVLLGYFNTNVVLPLLKGTCPVLAAPSGATVTTTATLNPMAAALRINAQYGAVTLTLSPANSCANKPITLVRTEASGNAVTISAASGETIGGLVSLPLYGVLVLMSTDAGWYVVSATGTPAYQRMLVRADGHYNTQTDNLLQLIIAGASDPTRQLKIGYDTGTQTAYLDSIWQGQYPTNLVLNPSGGGVITNLISAANDADAATHGISIGQLYKASGVVRERLS